MGYLTVANGKVYRVHDDVSIKVIDEQESKAIITGGYTVEDELGTPEDAIVNFCNWCFRMIDECTPDTLELMYHSFGMENFFNNLSIENELNIWNDDDFLSVLTNTLLYREYTSRESAAVDAVSILRAIEIYYVFGYMSLYVKDWGSFQNVEDELNNARDDADTIQMFIEILRKRKNVDDVSSLILDLCNSDNLKERISEIFAEAMNLPLKGDKGGAQDEPCPLVADSSPKNNFLSRENAILKIALPSNGIHCTLGYLNNTIAVLYSCNSPCEYIDVLLFEYFKTNGMTPRIGVCAQCNKLFVRKHSNAVTCSKECSRLRYEKKKRKATSFYKVVRNYNNRLISAEECLPVIGTKYVPETSPETSEIAKELQKRENDWYNGLSIIKDLSRQTRRHGEFQDNASPRTVGDIQKYQKELDEIPLEPFNPSLDYLRAIRLLWSSLELEKLCKDIHRKFKKMTVKGER